eukprot:3699617-Pyramimonas_sp.AAC.1
MGPDDNCGPRESDAWPSGDAALTKSGRRAVECLGLRPFSSRVCLRGPRAAPGPESGAETPGATKLQRQDLRVATHP